MWRMRVKAGRTLDRCPVRVLARLEALVLVVPTPTRKHMLPVHDHRSDQLGVEVVEEGWPTEGNEDIMSALCQIAHRQARKEIRTEMGRSEREEVRHSESLQSRQSVATSIKAHKKTVRNASQRSDQGGATLKTGQTGLRTLIWRRSSPLLVDR